MSGRHAGLARAGRRSFALLSGATVLGVWFGLRAPDVTPVAPPVAAVQVQVQPTDGITGPPTVLVRPDGRGRPGGGR